MTSYRDSAKAELPIMRGVRSAHRLLVRSRFRGGTAGVVPSGGIPAEIEVSTMGSLLSKVVSHARDCTDGDPDHRGVALLDVEGAERSIVTIHLTATRLTRRTDQPEGYRTVSCAGSAWVPRRRRCQ